MRYLLEFLAASGFVATTGFLFREHFQKNIGLSIVVCVLLVGSTVLTIEEIGEKIGIIQRNDGRNSPIFAPDRIFWLAIKDSNTLALFEEFIEKFPNSEYAPEAREQVEKLKKSREAQKLNETKVTPPNAPKVQGDEVSTRIEVQPVPAVPENFRRPKDPAQQIATGEWVQGTWRGSEYQVATNILVRVEASDYFKLFKNPSRTEIRAEGNGQTLYINGERMSDIYDEIGYIRPGLNFGAQHVAMNVKRGNHWTVAVDGKPWSSWFDELHVYAVVNKAVVIGVRLGNKWTIAVNGTPWSQWFDAIYSYNTYSNGSTVASVLVNGKVAVVHDGVIDVRLPTPTRIRIGESGKIAWYEEVNGDATVTVDFTRKWKSHFSKIIGLGVGTGTDKVIAQANSGNLSTVVVDDVPWSHWYENDSPGAGECYSSIYLRVREHGLWTLAVNDKIWNLWFDELGPIGCERSGTISVAAKKNDKWAIIRNGQVLSDWYADIRGWAISPDAVLYAVAATDEQVPGSQKWKVVSASISKP